MQRIKELADIYPVVVCRVVEAYLRIQLGIKALNAARHDEAAGHFADAINSGVLSNESGIHSKYEVFIILFGWNLASSWQAAHQNRCHALLQACKLVEARDAYEFMMDMCNEGMRVSCIEWSTAFKKECSPVYVASADAALAASEYNVAIELYSIAIDFDAGNDTLFAKRCKAKLGKMLWEEALIDARKVAELNPRSYVGLHLKHAALHGAQRYDEAIKVLQLNFAKLRDAREPEMQAWRNECHALYIAGGDSALAASQYDIAIRLYSIAIDLGPATDTVFASRCKAKLGKMLCEEALVDAQKVIELNPSSYLGYHLKHTALHGAQQYEEAIKILQLNLVGLRDAPEPEMQASKNEYHALYVSGGDAALAASAYDRAIKLYSVAIDLDPTIDMIFAHRCRARLGMMLWEEALDDAHKVTELNASFYLGYELKYSALHGMQQYDKAIETFEIMLRHLDDARDPALRRQYMSPSVAECAIQKATDAYMEHTPPRLINTSSGRLCDRRLQMITFKTSAEYKELLSSAIKDANAGMQRIQEEVATFFSCVMLSHRWEEKEARLHDIDNKALYELNPVSSLVKLQSFCKIVREAGHRWAWIDTCCIDQRDNVELQRSVNSMFAWYRHSALTIIYLSDVPPSSQSGAIAKSSWVTRGWTVQEFLAPNTVLFYQNDWTLYLDDRSSNHKESAVIMRELEIATGINAQALTSFRPGMRSAREKLRWASMRVTTLPEDIAYSLFGLFGVHLPVIYGETKPNALGRLLQEIIALSGDISCLDWVGKSSEFNSCLPVNITSYAPPPFALPSLSEEEIATLVSSLRDAQASELACQLYTTLHDLSTPRFSQRRLHLPCIVFTVTQVRVALRPRQDQETHFTYAVKANGLRDLLITTGDELIPFSHRVPNRQKLLLVRPWDRNLLQLYDCPDPSIHFASDVQSFTTEDFRSIRTVLSGDSAPVDSESELRALRLIVGLGRPFRALLLAPAQQWGREYKRIAANHDIVTQINDSASVRELMDVRMLEIL